MGWGGLEEEGVEGRGARLNSCWRTSFFHLGIFLFMLHCFLKLHTQVFGVSAGGPSARLHRHFLNKDYFLYIKKEEKITIKRKSFPLLGKKTVCPCPGTNKLKIQFTGISDPKVCSVLSQHRIIPALKPSIYAETRISRAAEFK